jgi:hypothetical protein
MISRPAFSPADELQRCAEMLFKYWVLAVPPAVASVAIVLVVFATVLTLVGSVFAGAFLGGGHSATGAGFGFGFGAIVGLGGIVLGFVALNLTQAVTMHAALDAFADRRPNLEASFRAVLPRLGDLSLAMLLSFALLIVPALLCVVLIGIPLLLVAVYLLIYVQAAVVLGGEDAFTALGTSLRLARTHVGHTIVLAIGVIVVWVLGSVANALFVHVPLVNLVAGFAIGGLTSAYVAMATGRFYLVLRDLPPDSANATPPPPPAAPPPANYGPPTMLR